jgi:hypothetical protein
MIYYHGTRSILPFIRFDPICDGSGICSGSGRYGGFFFSTSKDQSEYFTEWLICHVQIADVEVADASDPRGLMRQAISANRPMQMAREYIDGDAFGHPVFVPHACIGNIQIVEWEFVGDIEYGVEELSAVFLDRDVSDVEETLFMLDVDEAACKAMPHFEMFMKKPHQAIQS